VTKNILESLRQGFVLCDGGYLDEAKRRGYSTPRVIVEFPEVLRQIHVDFFRAGSQVLQALTWWTSRTRLKELGGNRGWEDRVEEVNRTAVRVAKEAAAGEALVAGCVCPTGAFDPDDASSHGPAQAEWEAQIDVMVDEGVDLLIVEGSRWVEEMRIALACCKKTGLPTIVTAAGGIWLKPWLKPRTTEGVSPAECARILVGEGADVVGVHCASEPRDLWPMALEMREAVDVPIAFQPVTYKRNVPGWRPLRETVVAPAVEMAEYAVMARDHGINFIGACCGAGPEYIRAMAKALGCERYPV
jgi:betaine-homocysteine S-methyltransferase